MAKKNVKVQIDQILFVVLLPILVVLLKKMILIVGGVKLGVFLLRQLVQRERPPVKQAISLEPQLLAVLQDTLVKRQGELRGVLQMVQSNVRQGGVMQGVRNLIFVVQLEQLQNVLEGGALQVDGLIAMILEMVVQQDKLPVQILVVMLENRVLILDGVMELAAQILVQKNRNFVLEGLRDI